MRVDLKRVRLLAAAASCCAWSCSDASSRFDQFEDRRALSGNAGAAATEGAAGASGAADCVPPLPGVVHGPAVLALETATTPGKAILFFGELETPEQGGATAVEFRYKALDALDRRSLVGEPLVVGPYPIGEDGRFDAPTAASTLPGNANASLPGVAVTSELTLHGTICGVSDFYCGTVTGTFIAPIEGELSGQFGLTLVAGLDELPARPRFGCAEEALAPALE